MKITKRDVSIFFLGMFTMAIIICIYDWKEFKRGLIPGYEDRIKKTEK